MPADAKGTAPVRIQLRRTKGWRKPEGAIVVARPSRWGNPITVAYLLGNEDVVDVEDARATAVAQFRQMIGRPGSRCGWVLEPRGPAFICYPSDAEIRAELAGRDLACWCRLDQPCHADVLLEIANPPFTVVPPP